MKIPWKLILIGAGALLILLLVGSLTGANQALFNAALDQLRVDKSKVVEVQAEHMRWYEETIATLQGQLEANKKKQASLQTEIDALERTIHAKDQELLALGREREGIVTSGEPDRIVDDLHELGYRTERRARCPRGGIPFGMEPR